MKKKMLKYYAVMAFLGMVFSGSSAWGLTVAAKKDGVKVFEKASKKAPVMLELKKGESLESEGRKGMYWKVSTKGKLGFVSVMKVKRKKGKPSKLTNALKSVVKQGRDNDDAVAQRSRSAVMGVRGLDESSDAAFAGNVKPNLRLVFMMEDMAVTDSQIENIENLVMGEIEAKTATK